MGLPFIWEGKLYKKSSIISRIYWEEKAFISSGTSWALQKNLLLMQKSHWWCRKGTWSLQKRSINVSCLGETSFSCGHTAGWSVPQCPWVSSTAQGTTGHWCWPQSSQKCLQWLSLVLGPSQVGSRAGRASLETSWGQPSLTPDMAWNSTWQGVANEGWGPLPSYSIHCRVTEKSFISF